MPQQVLAESRYPLQRFKVDRIDTVTPNDWFMKIWRGSDQATRQNADLPKDAILALDPGETTGVAFKPWDSTDIQLFQWETKNVGQSFEGLVDFLERYEPEHVRYEDYKVYAWKAADHSNASLHTPQWIGAIRAALHLTGTPTTCKMAQQAKAFWGDDKLKLCGVYSAGQKHARDALRHLLFYLTFPDKTD